MPFHKVGRVEKFPRDEHVDIEVREITLNAEAPESAHVSTIEIREFLREPQIYGHGLVLPVTNIPDLKVALERLLVEK